MTPNSDHEPAPEAPTQSRPTRIEIGLATMAAIGTALSFAVWLATEAASRAVLDDQLSGHLRAFTVAAVIGWLVTRAERRTAARFDRLDRRHHGEQYVEGYVDGLAHRPPPPERGLRSVG